MVFILENDLLEGLPCHSRLMSNVMIVSSYYLPRTQNQRLCCFDPILFLKSSFDITKISKYFSNFKKQINENNFSV